MSVFKSKPNRIKKTLIAVLLVLVVIRFSVFFNTDDVSSAPGYFQEVFTEDGTFTVPIGVDKVTVLVVAGGGGGGDRVGGGGGAGGLIFKESLSVTPEDEIAVVVGAGGVGNTGGTSGTVGEDGGNSSFGGLVAIGGGGGGGYLSLPGSDGGSGGGGGGYSGGVGGSAIDTDPPNEVYQGHDGGSYTANYGAGGGGGAGEIGEDGKSSNIGGDGGDGLDYSAIFGSDMGDDGWFAGGGGGSGYQYVTATAGGKGGGGVGGLRGTSPGSGMPNTGGGGGGRERYGDAGNGGSGIVIVRSFSETPFVSTKEPTQITPGSALAHGDTFFFEDHATATVRGFEYGISTSTEDILNIYEEGEFRTGEYSFEITGIDGLTIYYIRAYMVVDSETLYGEWLSFTSGGYYSSGTVVSKNVLAGKMTGSIDYFGYKATTTATSTIKVQFSQNKSSWYSSDKTLGAWDTLSDGDNLSTSTAIDLSDLGWTLPYFYYKVQFETSDTSQTPILGEVRVYYTEGVDLEEYYTTGIVTSKNLLDGREVKSIGNFFASSTVPTGTALWIQFATASSSGPWYSVDGIEDGWTLMPDGQMKFVLYPLNWSSPNFYYKIKFETTEQGASPILDEIQLNYNLIHSPEIKGGVRIRGGTILR